MRVIAFEHAASVIDLLATSGAVPEPVDGAAPNLFRFAELLDRLGARPLDACASAGPVRAREDGLTGDVQELPVEQSGTVRVSHRHSRFEADEFRQSAPSNGEHAERQGSDSAVLASGLLGLFVPLALVQPDRPAARDASPGQVGAAATEAGGPGTEPAMTTSQSVDLTSQLEDHAGERLSRLHHETRSEPGATSVSPQAATNRLAEAPKHEDEASVRADLPTAAHPLMPRQSLNERFAAFLESTGAAGRPVRRSLGEGGAMSPVTTARIPERQELATLRLTLSPQELATPSPLQRDATATADAPPAPPAATTAQVDAQTSRPHGTPEPPVAVAQPVVNERKGDAAGLREIEPHTQEPSSTSLRLRLSELRLVKASRERPDARAASADSLRFTRAVEAALADVPLPLRWSPISRAITPPDAAPASTGQAAPPLAAPLPAVDLHAGRATATQGTAVVNTTPLPAAVEHELQTQIVQSVRMQWMSGAGEVHVRLDPAFLGDLTVTVSIERNGVSATLSADVPAVRHWLDTHLDTLAEALREQGLHLERLVVEDEGSSSASDRERRHQHDQQPEEQAARRVPSSDTDQPRFELVL